MRPASGQQDHFQSGPKCEAVVGEGSAQPVGAETLEDRHVPAAQIEMGPVGAVRNAGGHVFERLDPGIVDIAGQGHLIARAEIFNSVDPIRTEKAKRVRSPSTRETVIASTAVERVRTLPTVKPIGAAAASQ